MITKIFYTFLLLLFIPTAVFSQNPVEMADVMRSDGKIYVVVAVLCTIFIGLIAYLIMIDLKVSKIEREMNKKS
jgi:hypothetical protein